MDFCSSETGNISELAQKGGGIDGYTFCGLGVEAEFCHALVTEFRRNPRWRAHEAFQLGARDLLELGDDLNRGGAVAYDSDAFVAKVIARVPGPRMHYFAGEGVQAGDGGPGGFAELAAGCDEDVGAVGEGLAGCYIVDFDVPLPNVSKVIEPEGEGILSIC